MRRVSLISSRTSAGTFPLSSPHANRVSLMPSVMRNGHARSQTAWPYTNRIQMDATLRLLPSVRLQHVSSLAHPACCAQHYGINAHVPCSLTHQPQPSGGGATPSRHLPINVACAYSGLNPLDGAPRVRNGMRAFTPTRRLRQRNRLARLQDAIPTEDEAFGHFLAAGSFLPDKSMTSQLALSHAQGGQNERRRKGPQG